MAIFEAKCQHCNFVFRADEEWVGQVGECPGCYKKITIEMPIVEQKLQIPPNPIEVPKTTPQNPQPVDAPHTTQKQSIPCPYCGVATKDKQVICTACGRSLEDASANGQRVRNQNMFCRNCGKEVSDKSVACIGCGMHPHDGYAHCPACGVATKDKQVICTACGGNLGGFGAPSLSSFFSTMKRIIDRCLRKKYAVFDGRAGKAEYWGFFLFCSIINFAALVNIFSITLVSGFIIGKTPIVLLSIIYIAVSIQILALFSPYLAVTVRRLHDTNKSGWWALLSLVPFGGFILLFFMVIDGNPGANQYGVKNIV